MSHLDESWPHLCLPMKTILKLGASLDLIYQDDHECLFPISRCHLTPFGAWANFSCARQNRRSRMRSAENS